MSARAEASAPRALARLYCPPAQRVLFQSLLGIEAEIGAALARGLEHDVAHARLGWWREECARLAQGAPLHPLTRALAASLPANDRDVLAPVAGFTDLATWDLAGATFQSPRELAAYCERWSAAFVGPLARHAQPDSPPGAALSLGARLRELELLNALGADARHGRLRLPLEQLKSAGVDPAEAARPQWGAPLVQLATQRHAAARRALAQALAALAPRAQGPLRPLLVWAALEREHSRRGVRALPRATLPGDHHAPLDGWRAWRSARRADAGRLVLPGD